MEALAGTSEALNALQGKFNCGEGNERRRFSECLRLTTAYLSTKIERSGDIETSIRKGRVFEPSWPDPVRPNPESTESVLQAEYMTRSKEVEKLNINLSTAYGLVICQCTDYLWSIIEGQDKWETISNEWDLLGILKSVKSLLHKYDKYTEYHHVAYHTLLCGFMLFQKGDYSNSEYKQHFKEQIQVLESYNRVFLFWNSPGATSRDIAILWLNVETEGNEEKAQILERGDTWQLRSSSAQTGASMGS